MQDKGTMPTHKETAVYSNVPMYGPTDASAWSSFRAANSHFYSHYTELHSNTQWPTYRHEQEPPKGPGDCMIYRPL